MRYDTKNYTLLLVWGGGRKDVISRSCIDTFNKAFKAERIIEWNETNCDLHINKFVEEASTFRKWAFVSDYFRLKALYEWGGVYFDTDIEVRKPFDDEWFKKDLVLGYVYEKSVSTAVIMAKPKHPFIKKLMDEYETMPFEPNKPNNDLMTQMLQQYYPNLELLGDTFSLNDSEVIFERHYFELPTFNKNRGYTIHHFNSSWHTHSSVWKQRLRPTLNWVKYHCFLFNWWYKNYYQKH